MKRAYTCVHAKSLQCPTLCDPHGLQPTRLLCPWDTPGKNTGGGCHALLQGIFPPKDRTQVSLIAGGFFITEPPRKPREHLYWSKTVLFLSYSPLPLHLSEDAVGPWSGLSVPFSVGLRLNILSVGQCLPELELTEHSPIFMKTWKGEGCEWGQGTVDDPIIGTKCLYRKPKQELTLMPFLGAQRDKENITGFSCLSFAMKVRFQPWYLLLRESRVFCLFFSP